MARSRSSTPTAMIQISKELTTQLAGLLKRTAEQMADQVEDYDTIGLRNKAIIRTAMPDIKKLCQPELDGVMGSLAARMLPTVLGNESPGEDEPVIVPNPVIPGLEIPEWSSVPLPKEIMGLPGWKRTRDLTPQQLKRIIDHRDNDLEGRRKERNKYELLRAEAVRRGCGPNDPIRTVFDRATLPRPAAPVQPSA
jgi:hypothetical protein